MKNGILIAAVVAVLVAAGGPPVFGYFLEQQVRSGLSETPYGRVYEVQVDDYSRGLYSSTASLRIAFTEAYLGSLGANLAGDTDPGAAEVLGALEGITDRMREGVLLHADIKHGPVSLSDGLFIGMGVMDLEIDSASPAVADIQNKLNIPYLTRSHLKMGFGGSGDFDMDVPAFTFADNDLNVEYSGALMTGSYGAHASSISGEGDLGTLDIVSPKGSAKFQNIHVRSDTTMLTDLLSIGGGVFSIERLEFGSNDESVAVDGASFSFDMSLNDAEDKLNIDALYAIDAVSELDGFAVKDAKLGMKLRDLDIQAMEDYMNLLMPPADDQSPPILFDDEKIAQAFYPLFLASPSFSIDPVSFSLNEDQFDAALNIYVDGTLLPEYDTLLAGGQEAALDALSGDVRVAASENLVNMIARQVFTQQVANSIPPDQEVSPEELQAVVDQQLPVMLNGLVQQGMLIKGEGRYSSQASFSQGKLTLNGVEIPLGP